MTKDINQLDFDEIKEDGSDLPQTEENHLHGDKALDAAADHLDAQTRDIKALTEIKKEYAKKTFAFMVRFVNFIGLIMIVYVAHFIVNKKAIPESVMIALITTTLATVIGLVGFILQGLFKK